MIKIDKIKIGILLRVSSKPQEDDGNGLDIQKEYGLKIAKELNMEPVIFNEGAQSSFSAEVNERVKLVELLDAIDRGEIQNLYCFNLDRLGRTTKSWWSIFTLLEKNGTQLFIGNSTNAYDLDSSQDKFILTLLNAVATYDNELRSMRSKLGKRNALKRGQTYVGGTPPFGYDVTKDKNLKKNKEQAEALNVIFNMYANGKSTQDIKSYLDFSTTHKPARALAWNIGSISKMLGNELYNGRQIWEWKENIKGKRKIVETIKIKTPKIIDNKLFKDVQKVIALNTPSNTVNLPTTIFDGLLLCNSCGAKLTLSNNGKSGNSHYRCPSSNYAWKNPEKWKERNEKCTLKKSCLVESTEEHLLTHLKNLLKNSSTIKHDFRLEQLKGKIADVEQIRKEQNNLVVSVNKMKREVLNLQENLVEIDVKILVKDFTQIHGSKMKEKIKERIDINTSKIEDLNKKIEVTNQSGKWIDWLNNLYLSIDKIDDNTLEEKRIFASTHLKHIKVEYDKKTLSHKFNYEFIYPIIDDDYVKLPKSGKFPEYKVISGVAKTTSSNPYYKKRERTPRLKQEELIKAITKLRGEDKLSLRETSEKLNSKNLLTPTNLNWNKTRLSTYIRNNIKFEPTGK